jgi:hypothetical protein
MASLMTHVDFSSGVNGQPMRCTIIRAATLTVCARVCYDCAKDQRSNPVRISGMAS